MRTIQAVIFDVGGVLHRNNIAVVQARLQQELGIDQATLEALWKQYIPLFGAGKIDEATFWRQLHQRYGTRIVDTSEQLLGKPLLESLVPLKRSHELARALHRQGLQVAILSNTIAPHAEALRQASVYDGFDPVILSNEVGLRKPDPAIYQHTLDKLGVAPETVLFIDDSPVNVAAAETLGIQGILFTTEDAVVQRVQTLVPGLVLPEAPAPSRK